MIEEHCNSDVVIEHCEVSRRKDSRSGYNSREEMLCTRKAKSYYMGDRPCWVFYCFARLGDELLVLLILFDVSNTTVCVVRLQDQSHFPTHAKTQQVYLKTLQAGPISRDAGSVHGRYKWKQLATRPLENDGTDDILSWTKTHAATTPPMPPPTSLPSRL